MFDVAMRVFFSIWIDVFEMFFFFYFTCVNFNYLRGI